MLGYLETQPSLRKVAVFVHRYVGLALALFLLCAAATGSLLVFEEELDAWLNPQRFDFKPHHPSLSAKQLVISVQHQIPIAEVSSVFFPTTVTDPAMVYLRKGVSFNGRRVDQLFLASNSGKILDARSVFNPGLNHREIVRWIYQLHYNLTLGQPGRMLLGIVALLWFLDCFIAFYLTLPKSWLSLRHSAYWRKWKIAWHIKRKRLNFDLHRAGGLWSLPIVLMLTVSGVYFNLQNEVYRPVVSQFTSLTTRPFQEPAVPVSPSEALGWERAIKQGQLLLDSHSLEARHLRSVYFSPWGGYYYLTYLSKDDLCDGCPGTRLWIHADTGVLWHLQITGTGTPGDIVSDWQYPLHSGKALGWPGRIVIFISGLLIMTLLATGIVIWWRKLQIRRRKKYNTVNNSRYSSKTITQTLGHLTSIADKERTG